MVSTTKKLDGIHLRPLRSGNDKKTAKRNNELGGGDKSRQMYEQRVDLLLRRCSLQIQKGLTNSTG